jgi:3-phenylpropionate/trans-cinnamate dioxygenase ferredoxin reductase subunit
LNQALQGRPRVLVAGTGFIGCEVAASARTLGCDVTLAGRTPPLAHVLGNEIGQIYESYHRENGVTVKNAVTVERFDGQGRLERAVLSDGSAVGCDVAVIGVGVAPILDMLQGQPIDLGNGIVVNEFCEASAPDVYAAGDVAFSWNPRYETHLRVEHFDNAQRQAAVAAKVMVGQRESYNPIPSFWSDQFSYKLQYRGYAREWDTISIRGNPADASFTAFYVRDGKVQAICSINRYKENYAARKLIGRTIDPKALNDDAVDIKTLAEAT